MTPTRIKRLMKELAFTQQQLADAIGAHRVTVADWVRGASKPTGLYLKALKERAEKAEHKPKQEKTMSEKHEAQTRKRLLAALRQIKLNLSEIRPHVAELEANPEKYPEEWRAMEQIWKSFEKATKAWTAAKTKEAERRGKIKIVKK